jgi:pilus assembly protein CpaC
MKRYSTRLKRAAVCLATLFGVTSVHAQQGGTQLTSEQSSLNRTITQSVERLDMLVKSNRILTLEARIPRFQVHNEAILSATPISENQIQLFAKIAGTTQINLWDTDEKIYTIDVTVTPDAREVEGILSSQLPFASLKVLPINTSAIVSGSVTSTDDVERAVAIVEQFYPTIVNNIQVVGVQQVLLHTRIMEVSRTKLRELGVDWGSIGADSYFYNAPSQLLNSSTSGLGGAVATGNAAQAATASLSSGGGDFLALVSALREQKLIKFLAEPTLVATHGRPARFNVGGRVPYLVPAGNGTVTVNYEEYGTAVDFLPFVVGPGRIRLEVRPEVTEPDASRSLNAAGTNVIAFSQRYAETAVELQAGQTFAIAGLLQSRTEADSRATPFLGELPVFGAIFRKVRHVRNDIELLITVTPELVGAMDPHEVPAGGPGLNSMDPTDGELYCSGHIEVPNLKGTDCNNVAGSHPEYIVPSHEPTVVGDGVSVSAPEHETYFSAPAQTQVGPIVGGHSPSGSTFTAPGQIVEGY